MTEQTPADVDSDEVPPSASLSPSTLDERDILAAFREVTGWSDALVLHYATCDWCTRDADCREAYELMGGP
ncbi:hypothetical protein ACFYOK_29480 [Microbispora bryophytorum]|uniref:hypothetical protein n=1 Tax=Microbispora bryophytorum TaxID=1460882 RepID=UPI0033E13E9C